MDVRLPDGTIIQGVPDGMTRAELSAKLKANGYDLSGADAQRAALAKELQDSMSPLEAGLAGAGKTVADVGRGAGQWLGLVSRDDVAESRKLDAPLMETTAGKVGNFAGNVAMVAPTAMIPGASTIPARPQSGPLQGHCSRPSAAWKRR